MTSPHTSRHTFPSSTSLCGSTRTSRRSPDPRAPTSWRQRARCSQRIRSSLPRVRSRSPSCLRCPEISTIRCSRSIALATETRRSFPMKRCSWSGGGNSGFQIAEELAATRKVSLAVGQRVPALPQRLLGKDLFWWLNGVGFMKISTDSRLGRKLAKRDVLIGSSGRGLRRSGVTMKGRLTSATGRRVTFEDGTEQDVDAIVWATGYRSDYSWLDVPAIRRADGTILHRRGVTDSPGLFFVGLPWQHTRGSALIGFVKRRRCLHSRTHRVASRASRRACWDRSPANIGGPNGDGSGSGVWHAYRQRRSRRDHGVRGEDVSTSARRPASTPSRRIPPRS